jgi:Arc/MetJ-type ribon-helix-helix transcriptional regulator
MLGVGKMQPYTAAMALTLSPELEERIERVVANGRFPDVQSAVEHAVHALEADDMFSAWPAGELQALIDEGLESERNEPHFTEAQARAYLAEVRAELERE